MCGGERGGEERSKQNSDVRVTSCAGRGGRGESASEEESRGATKGKGEGVSSRQVRGCAHEWRREETREGDEGRRGGKEGPGTWGRDGRPVASSPQAHGGTGSRPWLTAGQWRARELRQSRPAQGRCWLKAVRAANSAKPPTRIADTPLLGSGSGGSSDAEGPGAGASPMACVPNARRLARRVPERYWRVELSSRSASMYKSDSIQRSRLCLSQCPRQCPSQRSRQCPSRSESVSESVSLCPSQ